MTDHSALAELARLDAELVAAVERRENAEKALAEARESASEALERLNHAVASGGNGRKAQEALRASRDGFELAEAQLAAAVAAETDAKARVFESEPAAQAEAVRQARAEAERLRGEIAELAPTLAEKVRALVKVLAESGGAPLNRSLLAVEILGLLGIGESDLYVFPPEVGRSTVLDDSDRSELRTAAHKQRIRSALEDWERGLARHDKVLGTPKFIPADEARALSREKFGNRLI